MAGLGWSDYEKEQHAKGKGHQLYQNKNLFIFLLKSLPPLLFFL
jgi:hypothetical protein